MSPKKENNESKYMPDEQVLLPNSKSADGKVALNVAVSQ